MSKENIMSIKKICTVSALFAAFGLMACGDDSSSASTPKSTEPSPSDPVKCAFKEADGGLTFTKTLTIENKNSSEIETIETTGSCIKDECSISISHGYEFEEQTHMSFAEDGKIDEFYQNAFKDAKERLKEDCLQIDGKTRQVYENYTALMESISCTVDDSTATHYKQTLTKNGKAGITEYTLDETTITIRMVEPIINKDDSRCPEKNEIQNNEKQVTCDENFMTSDSKVEAKDKEDAQKKFAQMVKASNGVCAKYTGVFSTHGPTRR